MNMKHIIFACIGIFGMAQSVSAAPIVFDFNGNGGYMSGYSETINGVTVNVSSSSTSATPLYQGTFGLGVSGGASAMNDFGETLTFSFSPDEVKILNGLVVDPLRNSANVIFDLFGDGVLLGTFNVASTTSSYVFLNLGQYNWEATEFSFSAVSGSDQFGIKQLSVGVSEPTVLLLMGLGLLSMGIARTKRRKDSAA